MYNYIEAQQHIEQHKHFISAIKEMIVEYRDHNKNITCKLMNFLRNWLINHIQKEDKKICRIF